MTSLLATPELDHAGRDAIAAALDRLRTERTADETYVRTRGREMCVRAVRAAPEDWHRYSTAAARRAAVNGRWLLPVCGVGAHGEWLWIAYDIGSATPLSDYRKGLVLPTATCLRLLSDVARGLDDAIAKRVFPCELPLESVFVSRHGVRLGDLGTAREALGRAGPGGDTPHVPPEVLRGEPATARSGVYVFGALAYHLLTGASPKGVHGVPLTGWRPDLPAAMNQIVATAMSGDPERRPRSAGHVNELVQRTMRDAAAAPRARLRPPATVPQIRSLPGKPPPRPRTGEPAARAPRTRPCPRKA
jgi:hypothetical protein